MPSQSASQGLDARQSPTFALGIASPCSTCTNRRVLPDTDGSPACPRAVLQQQQQDAGTNGADFTSMQHLTLTGLEANPYADASPGLFSNPVYDLGNSSIYVWVARLVDNQGQFDEQGNVLVPPLTDPAFLASDTDQINCYRLPMVPGDTLAAYRSEGRIKEGDQVLITAFEGQQPDAADSQAVYGGVVSKLTLHKSFTVTARPVKDQHPRGT